MVFTLKPTIRHLALALPVLLTALPAALGADQDKLGPVLPPPSLYDVPPTGQPASAVAPPSAPAPVTAAPAAPPPAAKVAEPVKATPSPTPQAAAAAEPAKASSAGAPPAAAKAAAEPDEPWYRSFVYWLFGRPATQAKAQPASAAQPVAAQADAAPAPAPAPQPAVAHVDTAAPADSARHYASDASNRTIRSGTTGQCVKMGTWTPDSANADCHSSVVASKPAPVKTVPAVTPKSIGAASATTVALNQPPKPVPAGSAPAPTSAREYAPKIEPVEVVPLPPAPPAASEEHPLAPEHVEHVQNAEEEPITALAALTPMVSEPEFDKLSLTAGGLFALSSNKIKPSGQEKLDEMVEHLKGMQYDTVLVVGHTDPTGPRAMNDKLSRQRAESVKQYLVSKGVDPKRIKTEGKGGAEPVAKTQNCDSLPRAEKIACYAPDRRVDIEVVGGSPHG